jgi:hypothetical protein
MKLNSSDLMKLGELAWQLLEGYTEIIILSPELDGEEMLQRIREKRSVDHVPMAEAKAIMHTWVTERYNQVRSQHIGEIDCTACSDGRFAHCMLDNWNALRRGGYLKLEDPWVLKS